MIKLTLPDGASRQFDATLDGLAFAKSISNSLAKKALALKRDNELVDLSTMLDKDAQVQVITAADPEGLEILRHDAAHIMAEAVQELFPNTQVTIGPVIENGFYYDFARAEPFTTDDLAKIDAIAQNPEPATFANTIEALETTSELMHKVLSPFYAMAGAHTNPELDALMREFSPKLAAHGAKIRGNKALFQRCL